MARLGIAQSPHVWEVVAGLAAVPLGETTVPSICVSRQTATVDPSAREASSGSLPPPPEMSAIGSARSPLGDTRRMPSLLLSLWLRQLTVATPALLVTTLSSTASVVASATRMV